MERVQKVIFLSNGLNTRQEESKKERVGGKFHERTSLFASGQRQARSPVSHSATISGMESGVRWLTLVSEMGTFCGICDQTHSLSVIVNHYVIPDELRLLSLSLVSPLYGRRRRCTSSRATSARASSARSRASSARSSARGCCRL